MGIDLANVSPQLRNRIVSQILADGAPKSPPSTRPPTYDNNPDNPRSAPIVERAAGNAPLGANQGEKESAGRVHIRFVSVRKRLLDPDNISEKWTLDCLRNVGAIKGDEPEKISLETTQRKCQKGEQEHTEVTIQWPEQQKGSTLNGCCLLVDARPLLQAVNGSSNGSAVTLRADDD